MRAFMVMATTFMTLSALPVPCNDTSSCPSGYTCVAGEADVVAQACVLDSVCGGNLAGNCPSVVDQGPLLCTWIAQEASTCAFNNCKVFNGVPGIFKCMSLDRCDANIGQERCSKACAYNGLSCNGRGTCKSESSTTYSCNCDAGWSGDRCQTVVNSTCFNGQCGDHGICNNGQCSCQDGYEGMQCQIAPNNDTTITPKTSKVDTVAPVATSRIPAMSTPVPSATNNSLPTTDKASQVPNTATPLPIATSLAPGQQSTQNPNQNHTSGSGSGNSYNARLHEHTGLEHNGSLPITVTILAIFAFLTVVSMVVFGIYARNKKMQAASAEMERGALQSQPSQLTEGSTTPKERIQVL
ncbi:hypothetical protein THRCLA_08486 [Thraustotheca clavata]|uniref:EGF-like domain-containing protein n=1 Tax=Thraustotheca clavata TaxID=74557 RepID=A0A1V9Z5I9_9STRA|nr:hypothetical protein THRCLA_08486 [Thraustotheca clavata]